jgi:hypothetical protein
VKVNVDADRSCVSCGGAGWCWSADRMAAWSGSRREVLISESMGVDVICGGAGGGAEVNAIASPCHADLSSSSLSSD